MSRNLSPDDLMVFATVAKLGSLTEAAPHLGRDAATLGRRIAKLEYAIGATLFAKSPKGYRLTDAGQHLLPQAEALETLVNGIGESFSPDTQRLTGRVRIGAPDGCATFLLPQICSAVVSAHPGLTIDVIASAREMDLLGREVDIAITLKPPTAKAVDCVHLADYQLLLATAQTVLDRPEIDDPLAQLPKIGYIPELLIDPTLDLPGELGLDAPSLRSNSVVVQWQWLRQGAGVGLVHDFALAADPELVHLRPEFSISRSYYLYSRRDDIRFDRMRRIRAAVIEAFSNTLKAMHGPRVRNRSS